MIILKLMLKKQSEQLWTGFNIVCVEEGEGFVDNLCAVLTTFQEAQRWQIRRTVR